MVTINEQLATPQPLAGSYLYAQLPLASSVPFGTPVSTADQGVQYSNGATWQPTPPTFNQRSFPTRPLAVSAIGDSIVARDYLNINLQTQTIAQSYAVVNSSYGAKSWIGQGAMRSGNTWYRTQYGAGFPGATTAGIVATSLPAFMGYPNGLPDAAIVLGGTNDVGQSVPQATTIANLKIIYNTLLYNGVVPIAMTIPPVTGTAAQFAAAELLNIAIMRLAREYQIPLIDIYSLMVNPATGGWISTNLTPDNTHPSSLAASIWGYAVNQAIQGYFKLAPGNLLTALYAAGQPITLQNQDPMFQTFTGTINTASSYPTSNIWTAPTHPALCTVFNSSGTEPGTGLTMRASGLAGVAGSALQPNYLGNSFSMAGNGTQTVAFNNLVKAINYSAGDRIALSFRVKSIAGQAAATPLFWQLTLNDAALNVGLLGIAFSPDATANTTGQIGNETGYPAGDFYQEYVVPAGCDTGASMQITFQNSTFAASNTGDSVTIANLQIINLTKQGIVNP